VSKHLNGSSCFFGVRVTTEDGYFVLDGVQICDGKGDLPPTEGGMLEVITYSQRFTLHYLNATGGCGMFTVEATVGNRSSC